MTSTLLLDRDELRVRVADFLGYGRTSGDWSTAQGDHIDDALNDGLRMFYHPQTIPGQAVSHEWRFLKPVLSLTVWPDIAVDATVTVSGGAYSGGVTELTASEDVFYESMIGRSITITGVGAFVIAAYTSATVATVTGDASTAAANTFSIDANGDYKLPDEFGAFASPLTFDPDEGFVDLDIRGEEYLRQLRQRTWSAGRPQFAAVRPRGADGSADQSWELMLYPVPDTEYTLTGRYHALENALSANNPYPLGGAAHSQTILAACLAAAEQSRDDGAGAKMQDFLGKLTASISFDRRTGPRLLGYNRDDSDRYEPLESTRRHTDTSVIATYKGLYST